MLATLVGLSMLLALVGGTVTLRLPAWSAAAGSSGPPASPAGRRPGADPPGPAVGGRVAAAGPDPWAWLPGSVDPPAPLPGAEFVADDQGVTATVAAIAGAGLADYQHAAGYLADTWGCVSVRPSNKDRG